MQVEGQASNPEGEKTEVKLDLMSEIEQIKATNQRLLEESKKWKERAQKIEQDYELKAEEELSKEKDINKILEAERKRTEKLMKENKEIRQKTLETNIRATVSKFAKDVNDIDDLLNQPKYSDILKRGIDRDSLSLDEEVAKEFVDTVLQAKPYFRKQADVTTFMTKKPGYSGGQATKSVDQMDAKEIEETLFNLYGKK